MLSGYLLRDVVNLVDNIHFQSKDEIFTLSCQPPQSSTNHK
jgi:hypothetical protein